MLAPGGLLLYSALHLFTLRMGEIICLILEILMELVISLCLREGASRIGLDGCIKSVSS